MPTLDFSSTCEYIGVSVTCGIADAHDAGKVCVSLSIPNGDHGGVVHPAVTTLEYAAENVLSKVGGGGLHGGVLGIVKWLTPEERRQQKEKRRLDKGRKRRKKRAQRQDRDQKRLQSLTIDAQVLSMLGDCG